MRDERCFFFLIVPLFLKYLRSYKQGSNSRDAAHHERDNHIHLFCMLSNAESRYLILITLDKADAVSCVVADPLLLDL